MVYCYHLTVFRESAKESIYLNRQSALPKSNVAEVDVNFPFLRAIAIPWMVIFGQSS